MKRLAVSAALLVLVSVPLAIAQQQNAVEANKPAAGGSGLLSVLKPGDWISVVVNPDPLIKLCIVQTQFKSAGH